MGEHEQLLQDSASRQIAWPGNSCLAPREAQPAPVNVLRQWHLPRILARPKKHGARAVIVLGALWFWTLDPLLYRNPLPS
jgi:hypothetical protein